MAEPVLPGTKRHMLTVTETPPWRKSHRKKANGQPRLEIFIECRCDCGLLTQISKSKFGKITSCVECCHRRRRRRRGIHSSKSKKELYPPRLYNIWRGMKFRCENPKHKSYPRYGGRGITICAEWHVFKLFADWALTNGYSADLQIDRKENNKGYQPDNCHFITLAENLANRNKWKWKNRPARKCK